MVAKDQRIKSMSEDLAGIKVTFNANLHITKWYCSAIKSFILGYGLICRF